MSTASASASVESLFPSSTPPATAPEDTLYEVVDGRIVEKTMGSREIEIASILDQCLGGFARANRLGRVLAEFLFRIDVKKDLQRRPDVAFVAHSSWPFNRRVPGGPVWDMVPELAIEVVSPTNSANDVQEKVHEYLEAGVTRVWVVYPEQAEVYIYASPTQIQVLKLGQDLEGGDLLPGFRLPLAALFQDDPE
jgi:Uma2 family endonuclease